ncbi:tubulin beta, partial [Brachionus plicatilis]
MIQIQIGQCGNQVGLNYWDKLINEHKIGLDGFYTGNDQDEDKYLGNSEFVFNVNQSDRKYVPRAILVDSESSVLDEIRQSHLSNLF